MDYDITLEEIEQALEELTEENQTVPIIVEGKKDVNALRKLRINGKIIPLNTGEPLSTFCDHLAQQYSHVILLTDWDRKGGHLFSLIKKYLKGRVTCNDSYREVFASHSLTRTVEGFPAWINTLKRKINVEKHP